MMTMLEYVRLGLGCLFLIPGLVIFLLEVIGIFRMKYVLNRMHVVGMGDTLGLSVCLIGLIIISGLNMNTVKMALIIVFLWFSSPVASHLIARMEVSTNPDLKDYCETDRLLKDVEREEMENM